MLLANQAAAVNLRIVADLWPPYTDSRIPGNGLATDLVSTALRRSGYTTEYNEVPAARIIKGLKESRYDLVVGAWFDVERAQLGKFSDPYLTNRLLVLQRKNSSITFEDLPGLRPYSIAVVRGYKYSPQFDSDSTLNKLDVNSFQIAARMLAAGRVDLTLEDELVAQYFLSGELHSIREKIKFLPNSLGENSLHVLVRLTHPLSQRIISDFNREILSMCKDGTYGAIFRRHGFEPPAQMAHSQCR
ncbi:lysine-arginine-ornithine-binding periplasmic protein [compost metagenome]